MTKHARVLALVVAGLLVASYCVAAANHAVDDKEKEKAKELVQKLGKAIDKGDETEATKHIEELKKLDLEAIMISLKLREKDGLGWGPKGKMIPSDGIEARLPGLGKKELSKADLAKEADTIVWAANIMTGIAKVNYSKCTVDKKMGDKDPKDWKQYCDDMKESSIALAKAAKDKDVKGIKTAASKLNASCNNCHGTFRD